MNIRGKITIVLLGMETTGKSTTAMRYVIGDLSANRPYVPTIEDSYRKILANNKIIEIIDSAGDINIINNIRDLYKKAGDGFIIMYSIGSIDSWLRMIREFGELESLKEQKPIIIVGTYNNQYKERERVPSLSEPRPKQHINNQIEEDIASIINGTNCMSIDRINNNGRNINTNTKNIKTNNSNTRPTRAYSVGAKVYNPINSCTSSGRINPSLICSLPNPINQTEKSMYPNRCRIRPPPPAYPPPSMDPANNPLDPMDPANNPLDPMNSANSPLDPMNNPMDSVNNPMNSQENLTNNPMNSVNPMNNSMNLEDQSLIQSNQSLIQPNQSLVQPNQSLIQSNQSLIQSNQS